MNTLSNIFFLVKCQFKLDFNDNQYYPIVTSVLFDNRTMISLSTFLEKVISGFNNKRFNFNYISEMNNITIANKMVMSYDI